MCLDLDNLSQRISLQDTSDVMVKAYHCTRAYKAEISKHGLKPFDLDERIKHVISALLEEGIDKELLPEFETEIRNYISGQQLASRDKKICFCLNRVLFEEDDGCDNFFKYFGGEAIYRVACAYPKFGAIKKKLQVMGEPLVVSTYIKLDKVMPFQKDNIINLISGNSSEPCEVFIHDPIPPCEIINIEVFEKDT